MRIPSDQQFYLDDEDQLESEIRRLGIDLSLDRSGSALGRRLEIGGCTVANRFCVRMIPGGDAQEDGVPSPLTRLRFERQAHGGAGLYCTEPVALDTVTRRDAGQLLLHGSTVGALAALVAVVRASAAGADRSLWFLQLDDAGMMEGDRATVTARYASAASAAIEAGFDGVEIRCEGDGPLADIEAAVEQDRAGTCGFDHAALRLIDAVEAMRTACPALPLAVRLRVYTARSQPLGFGTDPGDVRDFESAFPVRLVRRLGYLGVCLLNMTMNHPALRETAPCAPLPPDGFPHEHPLAAIARLLSIAVPLREAGPMPALVAGGFSWLRQLMPPVAAAAIRDGVLDMIALERFALAYPDAPSDWLLHRRLDPGRCCIQCGACGELQRAGVRAGCVLRQRDLYGPVYREWRQAARLVDEAQRCHRCRPAPCSQATPAGLDIAGFMRMYASGDDVRAGRLLRAQQTLPAMCASLAPYGDAGERACIETVLSGRAVPIRELQYQAACRTRHDPSATVTLPAQATPYRVAVAGGGIAGIAAAAVLLGKGHSVTLYEQSGLLGGVPQRLIPSTRFPGAVAEIETLLGPALAAGRLEVRLNTALGSGVTVPAVLAQADALLLAVGLWKEKTLGDGIGVYSGLGFLEAAKSGTFRSPPGRAVVLAGGDSAMDAACMLKTMGADPLTILFGGARADMHWCMDETWFVQPGVHARMLCRPAGYRVDTTGRVSAVRVVPQESVAMGGVPMPAAPEWLLAADTVVEAMGLEVAAPLRVLFPTLAFSEEGWLRRPDASSFQTGQHGIFAAGALINGGASVPRCAEEGRRAAAEIDAWLRARPL